MALRFYIDHNVPRTITDGLRLRDVDVLTCFEDNTEEIDDSLLLNRASELQRVLFSMDYNMLQEATRRQRRGKHFYGIVYAHQIQVSIGDCIRDLEIIAKAGKSKDFIQGVQYLPI